MKFAILGLGNIACKMAETITKMNSIIPYAVASRDINKAREFALKWGFEKHYGSYEEMLLDDFDLVYIATPHHLHYEYAKLALLNNKNVLVEKPFTVNAMEAKELISLAKENNLFISEAIWTRYMPSRSIITKALEKIGKIKSLTANLGYPLMEVERLVNPNMAGGALLDLGVYLINFALMNIGSDIVDIKTNAIMSDLGIDYMDSITLIYPSMMAVLHATMLTFTDRYGAIYGEDGYVLVTNINNCEEVKRYDNKNNLLETYQIPPQITGFEYEVEACRRALEKGMIECDEMPHEEIIRVMEIMDQIRGIWNMKYPNELVK